MPNNTYILPVKAYKRDQNGRFVPKGINGNELIRRKKAEERKVTNATLKTWIVFCLMVIIIEIAWNIVNSHL